MSKTVIRVHPAIGIARLGNSPEEYFLGPEIPGSCVDVDGYRDSKMRLKRQGARFRLYEYEKENSDQSAGELNTDDPRVASIRWTVHLANSKAAGPLFRGILQQDSAL